MRLDHEFTVPAPVDEVWKAVLDPERVAPCMPGATLTSVEGDNFKGTVKVKLGPVSLLYKGSGEFLEKDSNDRKLVIKASGKDARGAGTAAATVTVTLTAEGGTTRGAVATDLNVTGKPAQFGRGMISEVGGKILDNFATNLADMLGASGGTAAEKPAETVAKPAPMGTDTTPGQAAEADKIARTGAGKAGTAAGSAETAEKAEDAEATGAGAAAAARSEKPAPESARPTPQPREAEPIDLFDYAGASVAKRLAPAAAGLAALALVIAIIRALRRH